MKQEDFAHIIAYNMKNGMRYVDTRTDVFPFSSLHYARNRETARGQYALHSGDHS